MVNGSVHTGCKQHQRVCTQICLRVLCEQGLTLTLYACHVNGSCRSEVGTSGQGGVPVQEMVWVWEVGRGSGVRGKVWGQEGLGSGRGLGLGGGLGQGVQPREIWVGGGTLPLQRRRRCI